MWFRKNRGLLLGSLLAGLVIVSAPLPVLADSNIETKICPSFEGPTITAPATDTETDNASITITGTGEPGMAISIIRNGVSVGTTLAVADGSYGLEVGLEPGDNVFTAREVDECSTIKDSGLATVHRTVVDSPQTPATPDGGGSVVSPEAGVENQPAEGIGSGIPPVMQLPILPSADTPGFLKPTITSPASGETLSTSQVWVGGQAQPGSVVTIYLNDRSVAYVIATEKGTYGTLVSLVKGKNTIQVRSVLGNKSATSDTVEVTFEQNETLAPTVKAVPLMDSVAVQITLAVTASVTVVGAAFWAVPELRHLIKLRWFK